MARTGGSRLPAGREDPRGVRTRGRSFPRPVSPGVSRPIIKQRPDGPLAHYHIHEHGKCIRSDTPPEYSSPRRARIVLASASVRFEIPLGSPRDYPGGHFPPAAEKSLAARAMRFRALPEPRELHSSRARRKRCPPSRRPRNPARFFETETENKGKKRDVDSIGATSGEIKLF